MVFMKNEILGFINKLNKIVFLLGGEKMKVLINGKVYDSTQTPILIVFDENEQKLFNGMKRFVSAPEDSAEEERQELIDTEI
jgi:hypothetical protein